MKECFLIVYHGNIGDPDSIDGYEELPCYPEEISDSQNSNWSDNSGVIGRSSPLTAYAGTGFRSVSLSFDLHRDMTDNDGTIERILTLIRKAVYPKYQGRGLIPPKAMLVFGEFKVKGIVRNYSYTWKKPIIDNAYQLCTVSIQIDDIPDTVLGSSELNRVPENPFNHSYSYR